MGHPMRLELTLAGLLVKLANHYTTPLYVISTKVEFVFTLSKAKFQFNELYDVTLKRHNIRT